MLKRLWCLIFHRKRHWVEFWIIYHFKCERCGEYWD